MEVAEVPVYDWHDYDYASAYVCTRASPLVCPNQELARQLTVISRDRGLEQKEISALSYARACAVSVRGVPPFQGYSDFHLRR